jgi:hypothetical protein
MGRRADVLAAVPPTHLHLGAGAVRQVLDEARLADSRLAAHQGEAARAADRACERGFEIRALSPPADESRIGCADGRLAGSVHGGLLPQPSPRFHARGPNPARRGTPQLATCRAAWGNDQRDGRPDRPRVGVA